MRVLLQFPEGLKRKAVEHAAKYEKGGYEVIISAEPSYGACDIPVDEAKLLKCDKIVHFGHTKFVDIDGIEVEYVIVKSNVDASEVMGRAIREITGKSYKRVGIITNASHLHQVDEIKRILGQRGLEPVTAKGSVRCNNEGQILGCDVTALNSIRKNVDCIIYFGTGHFHALAPGAMEDYNLPPVLWADPYTKEVKWVDEELKRVQKKRRAALAKAAGAQVFGILVSTKMGQRAIEVAERLKEEIEGKGKEKAGRASKKGRKAIIIVGNTFDFTSLNNFTEVECFVNTACPRMIDDQNKLRVPIINANEARLIL